MDLTRLAAKQKRVLEMREFIASDVKNSKLASRFSGAISQYSKLLANCWEKKSVTPEEDLQLSSIERELENLHEETRLAGGAKSLNA